MPREGQRVRFKDTKEWGNWTKDRYWTPEGWRVRWITVPQKQYGMRRVEAEGAETAIFAIGAIGENDD